MSVATGRRASARPEGTGVGAMLTDGRSLYEVVDARVRRIRTGDREVRIHERRLVDVADDCDSPVRGAWVPFSEVMALEVVRPVAFEERG